MASSERQPQIQSWQATRQGRKRERNLDAVRSLPELPLWLIADGFGPIEHAARASQRAIDVTVSAFSNRRGTPRERLLAAIERTNRELHETLHRADGTTGATMLAATLDGSSLITANVGRSRAYLWRAGQVEQITRDHTWVAEAIASGKITPEQAFHHPRRNAITRALGVEERVQADVFERQLKPGDRVLLCSDGIARYIDSVEIAHMLNQSIGDPCPALLDEATRRGGIDDMSAVVLDLQTPSTADARRLAVLQSASRLLGVSLDLEETIWQVMREILTLLGGEHAAIVLCDEHGEPMFDQARGLQLHDGQVQSDPAGEAVYSRTVISDVLQHAEPVLLTDALDMPSYSTTESVVLPGLRSIVCVPLRGRQGVIGALSLDTSLRTGAFAEEDRDLLASFASQAGLAIENARLYQQLGGLVSATQRAQRHQQSIIRSMTSVLIAIDREGHVTSWNPAAEQMTGVSASEAQGQLMSDCLPPSLNSWLQGLAAQAEANDQTMMIGHRWHGSLSGRQRVVLTGRVAILRGAGMARQREGFLFLLNDETQVVELDEARQEEADQRRQIQELFGRYLAPGVIERLLAKPGEVALGGARQEVTILFADLRGFTSLAESRPAEEIVSFLNQFLTLATAEIFNELGTLDKFMGDGVMAFFNAPAPCPDHPIAAVQAALRMRERASQLARKIKIDIGFGVGINTGFATVGNIGAPQMMNYTVIGDAVNIAARLEGEAGAGEILISEATRRRLGARFDTEPLGYRRLRGRSQSVPIFRVIGERNVH